MLPERKPHVETSGQAVSGEHTQLDRRHADDIYLSTCCQSFGAHSDATFMDVIL